MKATKLLALGVLLAGTGLAQSALAAPVLCNNDPGNGTITTFSGWTSAGVCQDQDKIYTYISNTGDTLPGTTSLTFTTFPNSPNAGQDEHTITFGNPSDLTAAPYNIVLRYSVTIDLSQDANNHFLSAFLDSTETAGGGASVTKQFYSDAFLTELGSLISSDGSNVGPFNGIAGLTEIWVQETFLTSTAGDHITGVTNSFIEQTGKTPAPGTVALLGLGLLGMARRWRKA